MLCKAMASPPQVLQHGWSASTLLSGIHKLDVDALKAIKEELPHDPTELEKLKQAQGWMGYTYSLLTLSLQLKIHGFAV